MREALQRLDPLGKLAPSKPLSPALIHIQQQEIWSDQIFTFTTAMDRVSRARRQADSERGTSQGLMLVLNRSALPSSVGQDALEEYRKRSGAVEMREDILQSIRESISFDAGFALIKDALHAAGRPVENWEQFTRMFPDVTATEVALCALLRRAPSTLLTVGPNRIPGFEPGAQVLLMNGFQEDCDVSGKLVASLVKATPQGLVFSCDYVSQDVLAAEKGRAGDTMDPYASGGVTGVHYDWELVPFRADVQDDFEKLIVLAISNRRIHERIFRDNDECFTAAFGVILRRAYRDVTGAAPLLNAPIQEQVYLLSPDIQKKVSARAREIERCVCMSEIYDITTERLLSPADIFRLIALVRNPPESIFSEGGFTGYAGAFGLGVRFISPEGSAMHHSSYRPYFMQGAIQNVYYEQSEIEGDCSTISEVFGQIVSEELAKANGRAMEGGEPLSRLEEIRLDMYLRHGIEMAILPAEYLERFGQEPAGGNPPSLSWGGAYMRGKSYQAYYTRKIGYREALLISRLLEVVPQDMLGGVKRILKKEGDAFSIESMMRGMAVLGRYCPRDQTISIYEFPNSPFNTLSDVERYLYSATLLHEIGESVWVRLPDEKKEEFLSISGWGKDGHSVPDEGLRSHFLSSYSHRSEGNDDFSEHFAFFVLHGGEFREAASTRDALARKYGFIRSLFLACGSAGDYPQMSTHSIEEIHGLIEEKLKRMESATAASLFEQRMEDMAAASEDLKGRVRLTLEEAEEELFGKADEEPDDDGRLFRWKGRR